MKEDDVNKDEDDLKMKTTSKIKTTSMKNKDDLNEKTTSKKKMTSKSEDGLKNGDNDDACNVKRTNREEGRVR